MVNIVYVLTYVYHVYVSYNKPVVVGCGRCDVEASLFLLSSESELAAEKVKHMLWQTVKRMEIGEGEDASGWLYGCVLRVKLSQTCFDFDFLSDLQNSGYMLKMRHRRILGSNQ